MGKEAVREHHIEHRIGDGHGERIAAESGAVRSRLHAGSSALGRQAGAHREAAAERLRRREYIGRHTLPLMSKELAGPPHPALHLVINEDEAELVADGAEAAEITFGRG